MLTNIDLDEAVVTEAMRLTGARSKRELVDRALRELLARAKRPSVRDLFGIGGVDAAYDPKAVGATPDEAGRFRVEEARAAYRATATAPVKTRSTGAAKDKTKGKTSRPSATGAAIRRRPAA